MSEKCQTCGESLENKEFLRTIRMNYESYEEYRDIMAIRGISVPVNLETNCRCHKCSQYNCATQIKRSEKYCAKHTITSETPTQCRGGGKKDCWGLDYVTCQKEVISAEGYCLHHENKCVECEQRVASFDKYCWNHTNSFCQVSGCSQYTLNWRYSNTYLYCSEHLKLYGNDPHKYQPAQDQQRQQAKTQAEKETEQNQLKSLVKSRTSLTNPQEVKRFITWWNNNLVTVINYDGNYYWVFLLVLGENRKVEVFPVSLDCKYWGEHSRGNHNYLSSATSEANWLRSKLKSSANPILTIHPNCDSYTSFNSIVTSPYVKIDYCASTSDFKPLDIAWVLKSIGPVEYYHVGIYLGNSDVCHFTGNLSFHVPFFQKLQKSFKVKITDWNEFLEGQKGSIHRYHPIVPFKNYKQSIKQAAKAWWVDYGEGNYDLANFNCEHIANSMVLGIDYSGQVENRKGLFITRNIASNTIANFLYGLGGGLISALCRDQRINKGKGSTINLRNEINSYETNGRFDNLTTNDLSQRIKGYKDEYQAQIQAPIKTGDCIIM